MKKFIGKVVGMMDPKAFMDLQKLPYEHKISFAKGKAQEFFDEMKGQVFCSVGFCAILSELLQ